MAAAATAAAAAAAAAATSYWCIIERRKTECFFTSNRTGLLTVNCSELLIARVNEKLLFLRLLRFQLASVSSFKWVNFCSPNAAEQRARPPPTSTNHDNTADRGPKSLRLRLGGRRWRLPCLRSNLRDGRLATSGGRKSQVSFRDRS